MIDWIRSVLVKGQESLREKIKIEITDQPIDSAELSGNVENPAAGASLLFLGMVRQWTDGVETCHLEYDCHPSMAKKQLAKLAEQAIQQFDLLACHVVHRVGLLELGEISIALAVSSAHRKNSLQAVEWLMNSIKQSVPIWKKEHFPNGNTEWIHHGDRPSPIE